MLGPEVQGGVFSAHAEVVPLGVSLQDTSTCILRARGGSSVMRGYDGGISEYSPRTRR